MNIVPVLTHELANRIEQADLDTMQGRLEACLKREGNPVGVEIRKFGSATALYARDIPIIAFNKVMNFGPDNLEHLDEMIAYFAEKKMPFGIDVIPSRTSPEVFAALHERGFYQYSFHTALYGVPHTERPANIAPNVTVRPMREEELELSDPVFARAMELPPEAMLRMAENNRGLYESPDWRLYLALVDDTPAGFAWMILRDGVAAFALAGTLPEYRGRGIQAALIHQRMVDAAEAGCELVVAQASFGSVSLRNLQKFGLQVAYTKSEWQCKENL
jgi:GNAT superfamily N-acetyltransferase